MHQDLFCGLTYDPSWTMSHVRLGWMETLLLLVRMFCICLCNPSDATHFDPVFPD